MPPDFQRLCDCFSQGKYNITTHGYEEMEADGITVSLLEAAIGCDSPEIIEDYPFDQRGSSCLILAWPVPDEAIHTVVAYWAESPILVTAYKPNLDEWQEGYRTRKEETQ